MATRPATDLRIQFICSHCGKALKAEPQKVGKRALCTGCGRGVLVPGLAEPPPKPAVDIADLPSSRPPLDEVAPEEVAEAAKTGGGDASAGPASLYLGGVNFVLFLSLAIMAGLLFSFGTVGLAILGVLALSGLVLSWRGWRLAREAMEVAAATGQGRGHAIAGRWSHGLIAANYLCILALVGFGFWATSQKGAGGLPGGLGGLGNLGDVLKPLMEQKKEADKLLDEINRR